MIISNFEISNWLKTAMEKQLSLDKYFLFLKSGVKTLKVAKNLNLFIGQIIIKEPERHTDSIGTTFRQKLLNKDIGGPKGFKKILIRYIIFSIKLFYYSLGLSISISRRAKTWDGGKIYVSN